MSQKEYVKDVGRNTFLLEWIFASVIYILIINCIYITLASILHILVDESFVIRDYLMDRSLLINLTIGSSAVFIGLFLAGRKKYRLLEEKPFVSLSDEKIVFEFGKNSLSWNCVKSTDLKSERILEIAFHDNGKLKKRSIDLKWLSMKRDFISNLRNYCNERGIPYNESEISLFTRIVLFLKF